MPLCLIIPNKAKHPVTERMIHSLSSQTKWVFYAFNDGQSWWVLHFSSMPGIVICNQCQADTEQPCCDEWFGGFCSARDPSPAQSPTSAAPCARAGRAGRESAGAAEDSLAAGPSLWPCSDLVPPSQPSDYLKCNRTGLWRPFGMAALCHLRDRPRKL